MANFSTKTVCIGGINASNVQMTVFKSGSAARNLDGIAVVSAVMAAENPEDASRVLMAMVKSLPPFRQRAAAKAKDPRELVALAPVVVRTVVETGPLSHNMTNLVSWRGCLWQLLQQRPGTKNYQVVQNFAANVALAIGASPIMSNNGDEAVDLAKLGGALVVNMGTVTPEGLNNYVKAIKAYNAVGQPVIFDPVGYVDIAL